MKNILWIAHSEWRYWLSSHLAVSGILFFLMLVIVTSVYTAIHIDAEHRIRTQQQAQAEENFLSQPDRHPHRMVHYGHYAFRAPTPLAIFDPGLDLVTGQSIFLEGHRQNSAMFAASSATTNLGGLSRLTPALVYQLFAPLIIILLGYAAISHERESSTLTPILSLGITGKTLILGKALALFTISLLLLVPLLIFCAIAMSSGESPEAIFLLFGAYLAYLFIWITLTLCLSVFLQNRSTTITTLTGLWFVIALVIPSTAVNVATYTVPLSGKIATDLKMLSDLRKLGDGHNASDPAFKKLKQELLEKYNIEDIESLPVNFRGMVAMEAEKNLTQVLNEYAELRVAKERQQENLLANFAWLTPSLAITFISRAIAGTDLAHYHRFQQEAETLRFSFVQGLNNAHAEQLSYQADINRNKNKESWLKARVDASNWQVLDAYQFKVANLPERISNAFPMIQILFTWLIIMFIVLLWSSRRIRH